MKEMSKTQIDRLGDRLRNGDVTEADLRLLIPIGVPLGGMFGIRVYAVSDINIYPEHTYAMKHRDGMRAISLGCTGTP